MNFKEKMIRLYHECHENDASFIMVFIKGLYYNWKGVKILAHPNTKIKGLSNITTASNTLKIGLHDVGFTNSNDRTYLNIKGKLLIKGKYTITSGCKFYIGENALVEIGDGGYVNAFTNFIIMHGMKIGNDTFISWNCQFLDEDYHHIIHPNRIEKPKQIVIGNHVWIGCNTFVYKGVTIADGCMIAANSVVKNSVLEPNCLIAGNPAIIVKRNIDWN